MPSCRREPRSVVSMITRSTVAVYAYIHNTTVADGVERASVASASLRPHCLSSLLRCAVYSCCRNGLNCGGSRCPFSRCPFRARTLCTNRPSGRSDTSHPSRGSDTNHPSGRSDTNHPSGRSDTNHPSGR
eukprot:9476983-Pyramimonas_sp.AAC.1